MAVTVTVGTNSYISVADADSYFADRLFTDSWDATTDDQKGQALIMATKAIDRQFLKGRKAGTDDEQPLAFPRCYPVDPRDVSIVNYIGNKDRIYDANLWCETEVPQAVIDACCEQALFLLSLTEYDRSRNRRHVLGVVGGSVGDANEYSAANIVRAKQQKTVICPEARELLQQYLAGSAVIR